MWLQSSAARINVIRAGFIERRTRNEWLPNKIDLYPSDWPIVDTIKNPSARLREGDRLSPAPYYGKTACSPMVERQNPTSKITKLNAYDSTRDTKGCCVSVPG